MKNEIFKRFGIMVITAAVAVIIILAVHYGVNNPDFVVCSTGTGTDGKEVTYVDIDDIGKCNILQYANYTPDEFLIPNVDVRGEIVDLKNHIPEKSGTYEFILTNIDPWDDNFKEKSEGLSPFLQGDNYWHFTLYLPPCLSACNVYVRSNLNSRTGNIKNYNFIKYTASNYQGVTEVHASKTAPQLIDVSFYTRQSAIPENFLERSVVVTVHYEAVGDCKAGLSALPMVGTEEGVTALVSGNTYTIEAFTVIAIIGLAVFIFLSILKRSAEFTPHALLLLGLSCFFLSAFTITGSTTMPYFWIAIYCAAPQLITTSVFGRLPTYIKKFPVHLLFAAIAAVNCVLSAFMPFFAAAGYALEIYLKASDAVLACALCAISVITAKKQEESIGPISPILVAAFLVTSIFLNEPITILSPLFWLLALILFVSLCLGFSFFIGLEKRNTYLTENLQCEVNRQTSNLVEIINERDSLLRYISHDLKKAVQSMQRFLTTLKEREKDAEQTKTIDIIDKKTVAVIEGLNDLQKYAKRNYTMESSSSFDIYDVLQDAYERLKPDCEANSITLRLSAAHILVFAKKDMLKSVLDNLIFNAIEHSSCSEITLSCTKRKNLCQITVSDNGNNLTDGGDIFRPYFSSNGTSENLGLGLFICRQHITSMGGELYLDHNTEDTSFIITLPLA